MATVTLNINNTNDLAQKIWNCDADLSEKQWAETIGNMVNNLKAIYQEFDCKDIEGEQYILGDTINLLNALEIRLGNDKENE